MYDGEEKFMQNFDGKTKRKNLRRPRHIWENNIKINIREIGLKGTPDSYDAENHKRQAAVITLTYSSFHKP